MRRFSTVLFALATALALGLVPQADAQNREITILEDTDLPGGDYAIERDVSLDDCRRACLIDDRCAAFTYNASARWCFLKETVGTPTPFADAISGEVVTRTVDVSPQRIEWRDLAFLPEGFVNDAIAYYGDITRAARTGDGPVDQATAQTLLGSDAISWIGFADRLLGEAANAEGSDRWELPRQAGFAAYTGFSIARNAEIEASSLTQLARIFEFQQWFRPALDAYRASLTRVENASVRATYEELREAHGFRLLDYTVDSDTIEPRICLVFSERIETGGRTGLESFATINGGMPALVTANQNQLCLEGLDHGQRYDIGVRPGLPSTVGEEIEKAAMITAYVRDRSPATRFTGRDYVLPSVGATGIPVVSVNTDLVTLDLLRIGDRALASTIASGEFRSSLDQFAIDDIVDNDGTRVWSGEMPVERVLNEDVTTAFPVSEAVGKLEPGVYILVAEADGARSQRWEARATQWFIVSDLGMAAISGADGLNVSVRSLASAEPLTGVDLRVLARNDEVLAEATTNGDGRATIDAPLLRGTGGDAPALVVAETEDGDYAFLDLTQAGFDLSDRGVEGRAPSGPLDAFVTTERGIYRAGERVYTTVLLRDAKAKAAADVPLAVIIRRPDGVEDRRIFASDRGAGGRTADFDLLTTAQTGTWRITVHTNPDQVAIGETRFLVEDFVPERLDFDIETTAAEIGDTPIETTIDGRYLYGAPAADLRLEGDVTVRMTEDELSGFPGYRFGLEDDAFTPLRRPLVALPRTDADGTATLSVALPDHPPSTRPLEAHVALRMVEPSGRFIERTLTLPVAADGTRIGVRPLFSDDRVGQGDTARFDVIALGPDGTRIARSGLDWSVVRIETRYQWYRRDGGWRFESMSLEREIASGTIDITADGPARIDVPVDWGRYRLEVADADPQGPATSSGFNAGWFVADSTTETPDQLEIALDKTSYASGETARLSLTPRFAGRAHIAVVGQSLLHETFADVPEDGLTLDLPVEENWGPGAYVVATLYRPGDAAESRMPHRAMGIAWMSVDRAAHTLSVSIETAEQVRPRDGLIVPVRIDGLEAGSDAFVRIAAVDLGILTLTGFETPDPADYMLGQRRLGVELRDLYGDLIDAAGAAAGTIRSGGDGGGALLGGSPPTQDLVAAMSDILRVGDDGTVETNFVLPAFNGTVRVMAIAWTPGALGGAEADVIVRDPVVATATVPRFLAPDDEALMGLDLHNVDGTAGAYGVMVDTSGPVAVTDLASVTLDLAQDERRILTPRLRASGTGTADIAVSVDAPNGDRYSQALTLPVHHPWAPVTRRRSLTLAPGESLTLDAGLIADLVPDTAWVNVTAGPGAVFDVPALLSALDRYPYGCAEQVTSRALPLLYLNDVARETGIATDAEIAERVNDAIARVLSLQDGGGSFGLWFPGGGDTWLDAFVTDFLLRAREQGYLFPSGPLEAALDRLANDLSWSGDFQDGQGQDVAFALYTLARAGRAAIGDLRYFADERLNDFGSALARAQLGAALSLYGEEDRAAEAFASAAEFAVATADVDVSRSDFGSGLRDRAAVLALAAASADGASVIPAVIDRVRADRDARRHLSTQESAWMLLAAHALIDQAGDISLSVSGRAESGPFHERYNAQAIALGVTIRNDGTSPVPVSLTAAGVPVVPEPPVSNGLEIARSYFTTEGAPVVLDEIGQNERLVVVLDVTEAEERRSRLLLVDMLPAGFEIDNPRILDSGGLEAFSWIGDTPNLAHAEFRDDRFIAAFDRYAGSPRRFTVAYVMRAVHPGSYAQPAAMVEDMYRPDFIARTGSGRVTITPAAR